MTNAPENDLLAQARALREKAGKIGTDTKDAFRKTTIGQVHENLGIIARTIEQTKDTYQWTKENVFYPVGRTLEPVLGWAWRGYKSAWNAYCYPSQPLRKDLARWAAMPFRAIGHKLGLMESSKAHPEGEFSKKRAGMMLTATFLAAATLTPTIPGEMLRSITVEPVWDGARMAVSLNTGKMYLSESKEIDPANDVHSVKACETLTCQDEDGSDNGMYFLVRPSLAHQAYSLATKGNLFVPDLVVTSIRPGINECMVTSYGARLRLFKYFNIFPSMLSAECHPINMPNSLKMPDATPQNISTPEGIISRSQDVPQQYTPAPGAIVPSAAARALGLAP